MVRLALVAAVAALLLALPAATLAESPAPPVEVTPDPGATAEPGGSADPGGTSEPGVSPDPSGETSPVLTDDEPTVDPSVDVSLPPAIEIVGDVRNVDGSPAAGATVYPEISAGVTSAQTTGEDGSFVLLVNVEPGTLVRIDAQGPATEVPGDDPACRYTTFTLGIVEVEAVAEGVSGVVIVLDQEGQSAVCAETGGPAAGGEASGATLPPTDAATARTATGAPLLALLLAAAAAVALGLTGRHGARRR